MGRGIQATERGGRQVSTFLVLTSSQVAPVVKNPSASAGDLRDVCSVSGGNEAVGISWTTHQSFCYLSASISLPCAYLYPQKGAVTLVTDVCGLDGVSI